MSEMYFVKVFPSCGTVFIVGIPGTVDDVDNFLNEHLNISNIEFWEPVEG